jgi:hypothetical protein
MLMSALGGASHHCVLLLLLLLLTSGGAAVVDAQAAGTWYVSASGGSDTNAGTHAAPFATIQRCVDTVEVRALSALPLVILTRGMI